jgi:glutamine amidotransferase
MCRLYAYLGKQPAGVAEDLVNAPNALIRQSCRDREGETHADGWGIGYYETDVPAVERGTEPASADPRFRAVAQRVQSRMVLAHVRAASVGDRTLVNTHPFAQGRWLFAHNGTVTAFDKLAPSLVEESAPRFLAGRRGGTDSELLFCWLMSRIAQAGFDPGSARPTPEGLTEILARAVRDVAGRCAQAGAEEPPGLNFVLTDGSLLVASRRGRSLVWQVNGGKAVAIASEPTNSRPWLEIPEDSMLAVDDQLRTVDTPNVTSASEGCAM